MGCIHISKKKHRLPGSLLWFLTILTQWYLFATPFRTKHNSKISLVRTSSVSHIVSFPCNTSKLMCYVALPTAVAWRFSPWRNVLGVSPWSMDWKVKSASSTASPPNSWITWEMLWASVVWNLQKMLSERFLSLKLRMHIIYRWHMMASRTFLQHWARFCLTNLSSVGLMYCLASPL